MNFTGFTFVNKIRDDVLTAYVNVNFQRLKVFKKIEHFGKKPSLDESKFKFMLLCE